MAKPYAHLAWIWIERYAPTAQAGALGWQMAHEFVSRFKAEVPAARDSADACLGYLNDWNKRWGSPFSSAQLQELAALPTPPKVKRRTPPPQVVRHSSRCEPMIRTMSITIHHPSRIRACNEALRLIVAVRKGMIRRAA